MPRRGSSKPPAEPVVKPYGCDSVPPLTHWDAHKPARTYHLWEADLSHSSQSNHSDYLGLRAGEHETSCGFRRQNSEYGDVQIWKERKEQ